MAGESLTEGPFSRRSLLKSGLVVGAAAAFGAAATSTARPAYGAEGVQQDWFWCQRCRAYCSMTPPSQGRPDTVSPKGHDAVPVKWVFEPRVT